MQQGASGPISGQTGLSGLTTSGFCFLVQIRAFAFKTSPGLPNLNIKEKTKWILVVVVSDAIDQMAFSTNLPNSARNMFVKRKKTYSLALY